MSVRDIFEELYEEIQIIPAIFYYKKNHGKEMEDQVNDVGLNIDLKDQVVFTSALSRIFDDVFNKLTVFGKNKLRLKIDKPVINEINGTMVFHDSLCPTCSNITDTKPSFEVPTKVVDKFVKEDLRISFWNNHNENVKDVYMIQGRNADYMNRLKSIMKISLDDGEKTLAKELLRIISKADRACRYARECLGNYESNRLQREGQITPEEVDDICNKYSDDLIPIITKKASIVDPDRLCLTCKPTAVRYTVSEFESLI